MIRMSVHDNHGEDGDQSIDAWQTNICHPPSLPAEPLVSTCHTQDVFFNKFWTFVIWVVALFSNFCLYIYKLCSIFVLLFMYICLICICYTWLIVGFLKNYSCFNFSLILSFNPRMQFFFYYSRLLYYLILIVCEMIKEKFKNM